MTTTTTTLTVSELKNCLDALEKEKLIRKELKSRLNAPQSEKEELELAKQLVTITEHIQELEVVRMRKLTI